MRLIDADELKKPVGSYNPVKWTSEYGYVIRVEDIDHAPTVDPVKHGQWLPDKLLDDEADIGEVDGAQCSECGGAYDSGFWAKTYFEYCPYCGAYMMD